ncbi:MAG: sigma-70 family RNA polymerase sigma factor [Prevotella sp.]|nr:sigma-70 family RNA polymerase sigma factor [Prevotella sp.]
MESTRAQIFEQIYRRNYLRLYRYALSWVEDEDVAKDIVSDLFSDLWDGNTVLNPETADYYLGRSIKNRCVNYLRHQEVERKAADEMIANKEYLIGDTPDVLEERMAMVTQVMENMSAKMRFVIEQHYLEGKKYDELAEIMGTSSAMVHKYVSQALAKFREAFGNKSSFEGYRLLLSLVLSI